MWYNTHWCALDVRAEALSWQSHQQRTASQSMEGHNDTTGRMGVLGIGLVMEEVGKGARLVFRYPASPPPYFIDCKTRRITSASGDSVHRPARSSKGQHKDDPSGGSNSASRSIDLFFDLPVSFLLICCMGRDSLVTFSLT